VSPRPMNLLLIGPLRPVLAKGLADFTVHQLGAATDREAFWKSVADVPAMAVSAPVEPINAALYARLPNLEIIASFGVGYDHIDAAAAAARRGRYQHARCTNRGGRRYCRRPSYLHRA